MSVKTNPRVAEGGGRGLSSGCELGELLLFEFGATAAFLELFEELERAPPVMVGSLLAAEEALDGTRDALEWGQVAPHPCPAATMTTPARSNGRHCPAEEAKTASC